jgi:hypothetical protein
MTGLPEALTGEVNWPGSAKGTHDTQNWLPLSGRSNDKSMLSEAISGSMQIGHRAANCATEHKLLILPQRYRTSLLSGS